MTWFRRHKTDEAEQELANTERERDRIHDQWPQVLAAAGAMDHHREINGFADAIRKSMGVE